MGERIPQSTSVRVPIWAFLSSDHTTPATGKTIAVTISKNGGSFGNPNAGATNATEISSGWYYVDLDTTDTGTLGPLLMRGTSATIDDVGIAYDVVSATSGGYTNLDAAISSRLAPTTAGRTLDVTATGEAGIDWANIGSPTTTVNLSGTTIANLTNLPSIPNNWLTAAGINAGAITAAKFAADAIDANALAASAVAEIQNTAMTESYSTNGGTKSIAQALYELGQRNANVALVGTTLTMFKVDGATPAETFTVDSATAPTTVTRAT